MKLYMVHVGFYDVEVGEGIYESHLNYFISALIPSVSKHFLGTIVTLH